ncbi:tetratricopeptide repeat protein [Altererythrobacter sp. MF3-039]|uniref:tetratricopeptide repeat protein n=1 Tax=Altererythrobacter sp. MF3-039 TaxID=3252901 RepID=UPI00390C5DB8
MRKFVIALLLLVWPTMAFAEWHKAESDHFVVYADDRASDVQKFAEMLEKYHSAMEFVTRRKVEKPSPSNRVTIYAVGSERKVKKLYGDKKSLVAGFYVPRAGGSVAFVPDISTGRRSLDFTFIVLLHEYAHHFLISSYRQTMPRWMNEGAAEFYASAHFEKDGSVWVGRAANHRAGEIFYSREVPLEQLFDDELYRAQKKYKHDSYYGRSWLLYHYLAFEKSRSGQLSEYLKRIGEGIPSPRAALDVFGPIEQLEKELEDYLKVKTITSFKLPPRLLSPSAVTVTRLAEGEAAMMPLVIESKRGVTRKEALELVNEARQLAAQYPEDAGVLAALAEAEFDSGNNDLAIAAADKAIEIDPSRTNAYVQKGYALFDLAADADDTASAYRAAFKPFQDLNGLENDHPLPLIYLYRQYIEQGKEPSDLARRAIERAAMLAPFDKSLWMNVGMMQAVEGKIELAQWSLRSVASDPHGGGMADMAQAYIDAMNSAPEGEPFDLSKVPPPLPQIEIPDPESD